MPKLTYDELSPVPEAPSAPKAKTAASPAPIYRNAYERAVALLAEVKLAVCDDNMGDAAVLKKLDAHWAAVNDCIPDADKQKGD